MPHWVTRETPFSMVYGAETILLTEIKVEIAWVLAYTPKESTSTRVEELDLLKEKWI